MNDSDDSEDEYILPDLDFKEPNDDPTRDYVIPEKSHPKYKKNFDLFVDWQKKNNAWSYDQQNLLSYFRATPSANSSSLWAKFSMLKAVLRVEKNVDIDKYEELKAYLKERHKGYKAKKAQTFTSDDIVRFLSEAPDKKFLPEKVTLIMGVIGACRREELHELKIDNLRFENSIVIVSIPSIKSNKSRTFIIEDEYHEIIKKYVALRPPCGSQSLFLSFRKGKCSGHPIGKNKIGNIPKVIATWLNLPKPEEYNGHTFRRSSAKFLADIKVSAAKLKLRLGYQSIGVNVRGKSIKTKRKSPNQINSAKRHKKDFQDVKYTDVKVEPSEILEGASTAEAQTRVAVEIAEQFLTLSGKTNEFPVTGIVNAPSLVAANDPVNAQWVDLARKLGLIASKFIGPNNKNISIDYCVCGKGERKFVKTAILLGLLADRVEGELNLISAQNFADELNIKINEQCQNDCQDAILIKTGSHEVKGTVACNTSVLLSVDNVKFTNCVSLQDNISLYNTKTPEDLTKIVAGHIAKSVTINNISVSGNWILVQTNNPITVVIDNVESY